MCCLPIQPVLASEPVRLKTPFHGLYSGNSASWAGIANYFRWCQPPNFSSKARQGKAGQAGQAGFKGRQAGGSSSFSVCFAGILRLARPVLAWSRASFPAFFARYIISPEHETCLYRSSVTLFDSPASALLLRVSIALATVVISPSFPPFLYIPLC
ncbi:uncharacterized protein ARB_07719 [Trichophyton benhamiae CBS 112371]|uniref:Uncharacterized protein n=1 Tax=Arthroderma benhamiae (strain ATCC MYA-4681 / CBS 112371) TaxID=663331 RepID=D4AU89_ARTBC|nr:uncharacterized protein ARB_07719 [Trichophyton benhamiae CBS 112371]EFE33359.1 hypothetical protein ARB_07719 [Trichophyton benhamiae CBS 112371]